MGQAAGIKGIGIILGTIYELTQVVYQIKPRRGYLQQRRLEPYVCEKTSYTSPATSLVHLSSPPLKNFRFS